jgi:membrane protease YdiL (CAAX protease family)
VAPARTDRSPASLILAGCGLGILVMLLAGVPVGTLAHRHRDLLERNPWLVSVLNDVTMLVVSFLLIAAVSRGRLRWYGLRWPDPFPLGAAILMPVAAQLLYSGAARLLHLAGLTFLKDYSLPQFVLLLWILGPTAEEVLARGLIQGFLQPLQDRALTVGKLRLSVPVLTSAFFFGVMHLGLFSAGIQTRTVVTIVISSVVLGLIAGYCRERSGSVLPAILAHGCFNATETLIDLVMPH